MLKTVKLNITSNYEWILQEDISNLHCIVACVLVVAAVVVFWGCF